MRISNEKVKPIFIGVLLGLLGLGTLNVLILFTNIDFLSADTHISISVLMGGLAMMLLNAKVILKYDSNYDLIEVEVDRLFSDESTSRSKQIGINKRKISSYEIRKSIFGTKVNLFYNKDGYVRKRTIKLPWLDENSLNLLKTDLEHISTQNA